MYELSCMHNVRVFCLFLLSKLIAWVLSWQRNNAGNIINNETHMRVKNIKVRPCAMQSQSWCLCVSVQRLRETGELGSVCAVIGIRTMSRRQSLLCPWTSQSLIEFVIYILQFWHLADVLIQSYSKWIINRLEVECAAQRQLSEVKWVFWLV